MWQEWKSGVGLTLQLGGACIIVSLLATPANLLFALTAAVPASLAPFVSALAWVYLLVVIPLAVKMALAGVGLRRMSSDEVEKAQLNAVERKQDELQQEHLRSIGKSA